MRTWEITIQDKVHKFKGISPILDGDIKFIAVVTGCGEVEVWALDDNQEALKELERFYEVWLGDAGEDEKVEIKVCAVTQVITRFPRSQS